MRSLDRITLIKDSVKSAEIALKTFFNIMNSWNVTLKDQMILLGQQDKTTFNSWKKGKCNYLASDTLLRISHIIKIYKILGILFPVRNQADLWLLKPNKLFDNESVLNFILQDSHTNLAYVSTYLNAQLNS